MQKLDRESGLLELFTHVIGLFGPTGVLPHHDTDLVTGGEPNVLLRDFLDIFNSRIITLFFHAWQANRPDVALEMFRRDIADREDATTRALLSLSGFGLQQTREQFLFSDDVIAGSAGLLSGSVRSASSLQRCIANQFRIPVVVTEFIHEQIHLPVRIQSRLDANAAGYNQLGVTAIAGRSVPSHVQRFEVRMGPLDRREFEALCPYSTAEDAQRTVPVNIAFRRLVDLIRCALERPLDFDIRLQVQPEAVRPSQLGSTRLAFDSWVVGQPGDQRRDDTLKRFKWDTSNRL